MRTHAREEQTRERGSVQPSGILAQETDVQEDRAELPGRRELGGRRAVLRTALFEEAGETDALAEIKGVRERQTAATAAGDLAGAARGFIDYWMGEGAWTAIAR